MLPSPVDSVVNGLSGGASAWLADGLRSALTGLLSGIGGSTDPNLAALVPVYDRMLAIAPFVAVICLCCALAERSLGGPRGAGPGVVIRIVWATAIAYFGIAAVAFYSDLTSSLAGMWTPDIVKNSTSLLGSLDGIAAAIPGPGGLPLLLAAAALLALALIVYLELLMRAALLLLTTAFIPLVAALAVWPRLAPAANQMAKFLFALLLSKFAIATAIEVGLLLISGLHLDGLGTLLAGVAVLAAAALSPALLFQGLHFAETGTSTLARGWAAKGTSVGKTAAVAAVGGPAGAAAAGASTAGSLASRLLARGARSESR